MKTLKPNNLNKVNLKIINVCTWSKLKHYMSYCVFRNFTKDSTLKNSFNFRRHIKNKML